MHTLVIAHNGTIRTDVPFSTIDALLHVPDACIWLDIEQPSEADIQLLHDEFGFHPLAIEDAVRSHERPKVEAYTSPASGPDRLISPVDLDAGLEENELEALASGSTVTLQPAKPNPGCYYFLIFYAAMFNPARDHIVTAAINMFVGQNFVVTVHEEPIDDIVDTRVRWTAANSPLEHKVSVLVHTLLDAIVDDYFPLMDRVADRVEDIEDAIFEHFREESIHTMFGLKKDLLHLRRIVAPERDVLNVLLRRQLPVFAVDDLAYLQDVYDHIVRVTDNIDTYRDLLSSALDSYLSLQSNSLNQIVKVLTIASIVLMAASLIAGIYGMNFVYMPELQWRIGHLWAVALMLAVTLGLIVYFRRKRWL